MKLLIIFAILVGVSDAVGLASGLYCGLETCYDVLGIDRDEFNKTSLPRIYRQLARKYHPDKIRDHSKKHEATERFRQITTAFETLKDDETREYYDFYLDNPEERFYHYYHYYRLRAIPKVDVRLVILGAILLISTIQYLSAKQKYSEALQYAREQIKFRNLAIDIARERRLLEFDKQGKVKKKQSNGANVEEVLGQIIEEKISISGGYKKESIKDTLLVWLLLSPIWLYHQAIWWSKWILKYWIRKEEYDEEAKIFLIRRNLKISEEQFNALEDDQVDEYFARELWKRPEFDHWKEEKDKEEREKLANSARYKQYRRYMKKQSGNTISFLED